VAVVGGGSAAFVEALYLTNMCKKVYLIHRREGFRSEKVMVDKLRSMVDSGKVEFILNAQITEFKGDGSKLTGIELDVKGQKKDLALDGVFVAIGHAPATSIFEGQLELEDGYIKTGFGSATATSAKGVFAAGDCADRVYRQAITSAGEGCKAALDVEKYLLG
jgi:thioredoxin reductase (NADPH)